MLKFGLVGLVGLRDYRTNRKSKIFSLQSFFIVRESLPARKEVCPAKFEKYITGNDCTGWQK